MPKKKQHNPVVVDRPDNPLTAVGKVETILSIAHDRSEKYCRSVGEVKRLTTCTCLSDHMKKNHNELSDALASFFTKLDERTGAKAKLSLATAHYVFGKSTDASHEIETAARTCKFLLPGANTTIEVCRSTMVDLTKQYTGGSFKDANSTFPSAKTMEKYVKQVRVFEVLFFLQQTNTDGPSTHVRWKHPLFLKLGYEDYNAKKLVRKFSLKDVAQSLLRVDQNEDMLAEWLSALVVQLEETWLTFAVPKLLSRGSTLGGYEGESRASVWDNGCAKPKPVLVRPIDIKTNRDKEAYLHVNELRFLLAERLHVMPDAIRMTAKFVRTPGYAPQVPRTNYKLCDLKASELEKNSKLFVAIAPISALGCLLQVWLGCEPKLLHVPYGSMLLMPGGAVYGGGFHMDYRSDDLTVLLNFQVVEGKANVVEPSHEYLSTEEYPMLEGMYIGGALHKLFSIDQQGQEQT